MRKIIFVTSAESLKRVKKAILNAQPPGGQMAVTGKISALRRLKFYAPDDAVFKNYLKNIYVFTSPNSAKKFCKAKMRCISVGSATSAQIRCCGGEIIAQSEDNHASTLLADFAAQKAADSALWRLLGGAKIIYLRPLVCSVNLAAKFRQIGLNASDVICYENTHLKRAKSYEFALNGSEVMFLPQKSHLQRLHDAGENCAVAGEICAVADKICAGADKICAAASSQNPSSSQNPILLISSGSLAKSAYLHFIRSRIFQQEFAAVNERICGEKARLRAQKFRICEKSLQIICIGKSSYAIARKLFSRCEIAPKADFDSLFQHALKIATKSHI